MRCTSSLKWLRVLPIAILAVTLSASIASAEQVAFFDFNDASVPDVAKDGSGKGNDGILVEAGYTGPGGGVTGEAGDLALDLGDFNNNAFLDLTDRALDGAFESIVVNDAATVAFWLFGNDEQPVNQWTFWFGPDRQMGSHAPWGDGVVYFDVAGCCTPTQRISKAIPDRSLYSGQWNHFAFVKDQEYTAIYLNGQLFHDSGEDLKDAIFDISEATFGADAAGGSSHGGLMDDIHVWDEALEESAIQAIMGQAPPSYIGGRGTIGSTTLSGVRSNEMFAPPGDPESGLAQEWFSANNPGNKDAIDEIFDNQDPIVPPFRAGHGTTWWSGDQEPYGDLVKYPDEVQPPFNDSNNDQYVTRLTGEINIPESGTYRFADGVDDFTWLAIDLDKSGVAGDNPDEVLIDDNAWTGVLREQNSGGQGHAEVDIDVAAGGEWLAIEFNQGEGGGSDAAVVFWDYDPDAPEGQRLGAQDGFPEFPEDPIFVDDAETMYIRDSHLRSVTRTLVSADLTATVATERPLQFDVDGDTDEADQLVVDNRDPNVFTTILNADGATFQINGRGTFADGDRFDIIDADQVNGTPTIVSVVEGQTWAFDTATGNVCFNSCGDVLAGDYNMDGALDVLDIDLQSAEMKKDVADQDLAKFDHNSDGMVDVDDRTIWVKDLRKTWVGDSNFDNEFNSGDLVQVFAAGKYETEQMAGWADGDWNGDMSFDSSDLVAAFSDGGYELGPPPAAAVPEPSSLVLALLSVMGLVGIVRRRQS